jgi:hypothetical protein
VSERFFLATCIVQPLAPPLKTRSVANLFKLLVVFQLVSLNELIFAM